MARRLTPALLLLGGLLLGTPRGALADNGSDVSPATVDTGAAPVMVLVSGGTRTLGDLRGAGHDDERPARPVSLSPFYLAVTEVTFDQYDRFCRSTGAPLPRDMGWGRGERPVINVSWEEAAAYCNWLSDLFGLTRFYVTTTAPVVMDWSATGYRLPTEAEWEYAARGAAEGGESAGTAWLQGTANGRTQPVAGGNAGLLGLYDMLGNAGEWCNDWYGPYPAGAAVDPRGPDAGQHRVFRGGSWYDTAVNVRVSMRSRHVPTQRLPTLGFRVARHADASWRQAAG